ncbi:juvenile hormone epoxide hydrolase 1-like [Agrilus planipennis]|uniref:Juvenile hormone epoxide hydrolase 1-like n=1 Tax=Agrilus planipennis TaxID=224129 RepID=A0A7F5R7T5_AGRPL|nr:juvenile hormone epoxide hydrolase 1-like [Agrilus planipennis]
MIYWVTESITTSVRLYAENFSKENRTLQLEGVPIEVPTALALFKNEFYYTPPSLVAERYKNVLQLSDIPDGGHFAAMEVPQMLADDIWQAVEKIHRYRRYIYRE